MRRFVYYNNSGNPINGEPSTAPDFYRYMNGLWKNGQKMAYGGDGVSAATGANLDVSADYMFPGDTDPFNWGTGGESVEPWTEVSSGNPPADRRFIQAAGPFTLEPGDYNNITMGVVWARATAGDPEESVKLLRIADDKAQALFDNCFEIVSGPDAPDVTIQEMENELILYLTNNNPLSNNFREDYRQLDPGIPKVDVDGNAYDSLTRSYTFEGYLIYQLANSEVSPADLGDINQARLIRQCDVVNDIDVVVNYVQDNDMGLPVPTLMANGDNDGVQAQLPRDDRRLCPGRQPPREPQDVLLHGVGLRVQQLRGVRPHHRGWPRRSVQGVPQGSRGFHPGVQRHPPQA